MERNKYCFVAGPGQHLEMVREPGGINLGLWDLIWMVASAVVVARTALLLGSKFVSCGKCIFLNGATDDKVRPHSNWSPSCLPFHSGGFDEFYYIVPYLQACRKNSSSE